jgi:hypothetical protein
MKIPRNQIKESERLTGEMVGGNLSDTIQTAHGCFSPQRAVL